MLNLMLTITGIGAVIVLGIAFFVSNSITKPVRAMTHIVRQLAGGDLNLSININRQDEIGVMANASRQMIANLRQVIDDIVQVSQGLAKGRLSVRPQSEYRGDFVQIKNALETALSNQRQVIEDIVQVSQGLAQGILSIISQAEYQGDFIQIKDALETALTDLRRVIEDIVQVSQGLAEGDQNITPQADYRGDFVQIKNALETAAAKLAATTKQNVSQDWLKTGQNQLNDQMSGEPNLVELTYNLVSFITLYLEAQIGLCYLVEESANHHNRRLKLTASYAQARRKNIAEEFEFSEGLVGRAAREQKSILISIDAGLEEETVPRHIIVIPFLYENTVKGVVLIASQEVFSEIQQDFIHQVMPSIGIAVNSVESRTKMQELLQQTQIQAQELQSQQEELQQSNEELQSQSEELQTQSEELQSQAEELRQTNEALEARTQTLERQKNEIREKNLALEKTQQAMAAKAQELELASKYKSEFLANMSHELRTPLNSLLILAQLLADNKKGNLTDKQVEYARTIHSAGSDLLTLINDILDLSKVEAGKMEVHVDDVPVAELVAILEQKFRHVAEEKGLTFNLMVAENLPPVIKTDGQKLHQIINNLLSNAFKFTREGEVKVMVQRPKSPQWPLSQRTLQQTGAGEDFIALSVTDTGIGIPTEKQQIIFEAFQQVDGTTSRRYGGTGLGLSISRQLAKLLGGDIQLHSEEDKGSTFTLYLPETFETRNSGVNEFTSFGVQAFSLSGGKESEASVASHDGLTPRTAGEKIETPSFQKTGVLESTEQIADIADDRESLKPEDKSILIVEDERKFSHILMEIAREKHFKCILAEDGRTGLQLAEQFQPNAIILDIGLPQLDGWTVMERLKGNPDTRHIPVHFMSASDQSMDAKKMGAIGYLLKPVSMEQLGAAFQSIEQFLAQTAKNVLVVADNEPRQQNILDLVKDENIQITLAITKAFALEHLQMSSFDCVILDMDIEQKSGCQLLEQMQSQENLCEIPLIVYADRELTTSEETLLQQCADSLPVKSVRSPERLLDEATLFLHQIAANLPKEKRNMLRMVHDKAAILRKKRVLIVDDDVRNVFALATVLEDKDMEVVCAQNGYEALALLKTYENIALVLMDIMMPEMDGYEAMRQIRKQPRYRQLPIIALTAKAMKGDKAKCIEAGANDYLSKPVDTDKLISLMRVWLYR
jgi:signal transduction histidine kinase/CheY-like chemotaxis protein